MLLNTFLLYYLIYIIISNPECVVLAEMAMSEAGPVGGGAVLRSDSVSEIVVRKNFPEVFVWSDLTTTAKEGDK